MEDKKRPCPETAACDEALAAAIALALYLEEGHGAHDAEPGTLTFRFEGSPWADKAFTLRKYPLR